MTKYFKDRFEKYLKEVEDADIRGLEAYYDIQPSRISIGYSGERFDGHNDEDKKKMIKILNNTAQFESLIGDILKLAYKNSNIRYEYQGNHSNPYFGKEFTMYNLPFNLSETSNSYQNKEPHPYIEDPKIDPKEFKKNKSNKEMLIIKDQIINELENYIKAIQDMKGGIGAQYEIDKWSDKNEFEISYFNTGYYTKQTAKQALDIFRYYETVINKILQPLYEKYDTIITGEDKAIGSVKIGKCFYVKNLPFQFEKGAFVYVYNGGNINRD